MAAGRASFCLRCGAALAQKKDRDGVQRLSCAVPGCDYVFYNNPVPVVAAVVEQPDDDGSSVILVRGNGWPENWFGLVTGFLEKGETVETAVLREIKEELGLDGKIQEFLGVFDFLRMNQIFLAYHVRVPRAPIVLDTNELSAYKKVPIHRLQPFPGPTGKAVEEFLLRRAKSLRTSAAGSAAPASKL